MMHINHLYEDNLLKISEIKDIIKTLSSGLREVTEKIDGQNILLSYSVLEQRVKVARNKSDIEKRGIVINEMVDRYQKIPLFQTTLKEALSIWESIIKRNSSYVNYQIFGANANSWYNAELVDSRNPNLINYGQNLIVIHENGHIFEKNSQNLEVLKNNVIQENNSPWGVRFKERFKTKTPTTILEQTLDSLDEFRHKLRVSENFRVIDIKALKVVEQLQLKLPHLSENVKGLITKKAVGAEKIQLSEIYSALTNDYDKQTVKEFLELSKKLIKESTKPLEKIIHEFSVNLLNETNSRFVKDKDSCIAEIKKRMYESIEEIKKSQGPKALSILEEHSGKILDSKISAIEGVVFEYDNRLFKLTGNFAPINQIVGVTKYKRELLSEQSTEKVYAVFAGKFKPPHAGHFLGAKELANLSNVNEVIVFISPIEKEGITAEQSKKIWEIYSRELEPKIVPMISTHTSPLHSVFEFAKALKPGEKIIVAESQKEGVGKYKGLKEWVARFNPEVLVETFVGTQNSLDITGTKVRGILSEQNSEEDKFFKCLPEELTLESKKQVLDIIRNEQKPPIDEMSAMGGGAMTAGLGVHVPKKNKGKRGPSKMEKTNRDNLVSEFYILDVVDKLVLKSEKEKRRLQTQEIYREYLIRRSVRDLLNEVKFYDKVPYESTGVNVLRECLKEIIPILEAGYKNLTTDKAQRDSFRIHILNAVIDAIRPPKSLQMAQVAKLAGLSTKHLRGADSGPSADSGEVLGAPPEGMEDTATLNEEFEIQESVLTSLLEADEVQEPVSKATPKAPIPSEEEMIEVDPKKIKSKETPAEIPEEELFGAGLDDKIDRTGRNFALRAFQKIEKNIVGRYEELGNDEDKQIFYVYLLTNIKLYFDRFEREIITPTEEPTTQEYEQEKGTSL